MKITVEACEPDGPDVLLQGHAAEDRVTGNLRGRHS